MNYEELIIESGLDEIHEVDMSIKGLYADGIIALKRDLTSTQKTCVLAEELGHYHTSTGDILDQSNVSNRKQERRARAWAYEKLLPPVRFIDAYKSGCGSVDELIDYLEVTKEFLVDAINFYIEKHGNIYEIGEYIIYFEPLGVLRRL